MLPLAVLLASSPPAHAGGNCTTQSYDSTNVPTPVPGPSPDPEPTDSTLAVPAAGPVHDLGVRLDISHPFDADLTIELLSPGGGKVTLAEGVGTWGDDFTGTAFDDEASTSIISALPPFSGSFRPAEALEGLEGGSRAGIWKLRVTDRHGGYDGEITDWGLDIGACADVSPPTGQAITVPATTFQTKPSFALGWAAGSDPSGVASRDVDYWEATHEDGFGPPVHFRDHTTATSASFADTTPGSTYCFTERLRDAHGNESQFGELRCAASPLNETALTASAGWSQRVNAAYYLGDASQSRAKGATLTSETITGDSLALVATKCRRCGRVSAFLDGELLKVVSLKAEKTKRSRVIPLATLPQLETGEVELRVATRRKKVIVEGLGITRSAIQQLPEVWEEAGAPDPPPLPTGVPTGTEEAIGTVVTVTTNSDVSDGDTSSVTALEANPGGDGELSLREVIEATNNSAGKHTVAFDPALSGETITIAPFALPHLVGDGLFINGDLDDDGEPDVTIADGAGENFGLIVSSSDNRLHALAVRDFEIAGVLMCPAPCFPPDPGQTLMNNVLSGLEIDGVDQAIFQSGGGGGDVATDDHWIDTRVVANSIEAERSGIDFNLHHTTGDSIERVTVAGNSILIDDDGSIPSLFGVNLESGIGDDTDGNLISESLVAYNAVAGTPETAYRVTANGAGVIDGVGNVAEDIRFLSNRAELDPAQNVGGFGTSGVAVLAGDDFFASADDVVRRIEISGNLVDGYGREGIKAIAGCCAAQDGRLEDVLIENNAVSGVLGPMPDAFNNVSRGILITGSSGTDAAPATANLVEDVRIHGNSVEIENEGGTPTAELNSGGIVVGGSEAAQANRVEGISLEGNRVVTDAVGVNVNGGFARFPTPQDASGNEVRDAKIRGNLVLLEPTLVGDSVPGIRGLSVIGGTGFVELPVGSWAATGNSVTCVTIEDNIVAGVLDDFYLADNVGPGASGNTATTGGCAP